VYVHGGMRALLPCAGRVDVALALHACGAATDYALLQAASARAAYIVSPCCIGKIRQEVETVPGVGPRSVEVDDDSDGRSGATNKSTGGGGATISAEDGSAMDPAHRLSASLCYPRSRCVQLRWD
jgi:hypothetical protein